jgi:5'-nucleotidase/UDP-sugar diphosphatase
METSSMKLRYLPIFATAALIAGCNSDSSQEITLKLLHINDHHSHLDSESTTLTVDGVETDVEIGGFPRVVAMIDQLASASSNPVLKLHAGDAITGDLYYTLFKGEADAALMNEVCFDAFELGNHEFDDGDEGLVQFLDWLNEGNCNTVALAANVVPELGVSPLALNSQTDYFQPYLLKEVEGETVAIIGLDIASKTKNSSSPDATTEFLDEAETAQYYIDELKEQGVNRIVLLTHYQYANDLTLASQLTDVDVIVGGDSHSLLGSGYADFGLNPEGEYPTRVSNADGDTVCVVQAWQYSYVVGELNVTFNEDGQVKSCSGQPHLLLGDTLTQNDVELSGSEYDAVATTLTKSGLFSFIEPDADAAAVLAGFADEVDTLQTQVIGTSTDDLCLERIPGQGQSTLCDVSDTASHGSDISNVVALAFKEMSLRSDVSIQNAGGVRVDLAAGDITIGDAYTLLPFANTIVELEMTGAEIKSTLEDALDYALSEGGSTGAYPYASGLRWDVDLSQAKGSRFFNVQIKRKADTDWSTLGDTDSVIVATNNYIAQGKDGYDTFGVVFNDGRVVDTYLDYAKSFVDYVTEQGSISRLPESDYSTQAFYDENGVLQ